MIAGTGAVIQNGTGTLVLNGVNTCTRPTSISASTLAISGGSTNANKGTLSLADTASAILQVKASETIDSLQSGGLSGGGVILAAEQTPRRGGKRDRQLRWGYLGRGRFCEIRRRISDPR